MSLEPIGGGKGKRTSRRVITIDPQFKVEVSFEEIARLCDIEGVDIGTYVSTTKPDGTLVGEGQGVFASQSGDMATWKGLGTGSFGANGSVSYRGAVCYQTTSPKLAALNSAKALFEFEVDAEGNTVSKILNWQ